MEDRVARVEQKVEVLCDLVDGNKEKDIKGLRPRMEEVEAVVKKWRELSNMARGVAIGLGINLFVALLTLLTLWKTLSEVTAAIGRVP